MEKLNIVIADDEAIIRLDLKEMLTSAGHKVIGEASTGRQALKLVQQKKPDLVIMDVKMPDLDGLAAAKKIHDDDIAPVMLLTAFSQAEFIERAKKAGVLAYLVKPVQESNLFPAVEIAVSRWREIKNLEAELGKLKENLEGRKMLDRARGIIMDTYGLSEAEAYKKIQQYSMKKHKSIKEIAEEIITAST